MGMLTIFAAQLLAPPACIVNNLYRPLATMWLSVISLLNDELSRFYKFYKSSFYPGMER